MAFLGVISVYLNYRILTRIGEEGRNSQTSFQFNTKKVISDFTVLLGGEFILAVSSVVYIYGCCTLSHTYITLGEALTMAFFLLLLAIIYRWWRRSR